MHTPCQLACEATDEEFLSIKGIQLDSSPVVHTLNNFRRTRTEFVKTSSASFEGLDDTTDNSQVFDNGPYCRSATIGASSFKGM